MQSSCIAYKMNNVKTLFIINVFLREMHIDNHYMFFVMLWLSEMVWIYSHMIHIWIKLQERIEKINFQKPNHVMDN